MEYLLRQVREAAEEIEHSAREAARDPVYLLDQDVTVWLEAAKRLQDAVVTLAVAKGESRR